MFIIEALRALKAPMTAPLSIQTGRRRVVKATIVFAQSQRLLELSNSGSPPAEPGAYLREVKGHPRIRSAMPVPSALPVNNRLVFQIIVNDQDHDPISSSYQRFIPIF